MTKMLRIDNIEVCKPIELLVNLLKTNGFEIIDSTISDYHFNECRIDMKGKDSEILDCVEIGKISKFDNLTFHCSCHWSIVKIRFE